VVSRTAVNVPVSSSNHMDIVSGNKTDMQRQKSLFLQVHVAIHRSSLLSGRNIYNFICSLWNVR